MALEALARHALARQNHSLLLPQSLRGRRDREPPEALARAWGAWPPSSTPRASVSVAGPSVTRLRATDRHGAGRLRLLRRGGQTNLEALRAPRYPGPPRRP